MDNGLEQAAEELVHLELAACTVDLKRCVVQRGADKTTLTQTEVQLLRYLATHPETAISREKLHQEVWGYNAQIYTRAVDSAVKRLRPKIEADPSNPEHLITVYSVGYRFEPLAVEEAQDSPPTTASTAAPQPTDGPQTNLVGETTHFFGRADALEKLTGWLESDQQLVSIVGTGGTGKTRLAKQAAGQWAHGDKQGFAQITFCDLTEVHTADGFMHAVATTFDVPLPETEDPQANIKTLADHLQGLGPCLLILDNFDAVVALAAPIVEQWTQQSPQLRVLVTSRERLRLAGEACLELDPLSTPYAAELFVNRARLTSRTEISPTDATVLAIVARLEGLPLAIELAAVRLNLFSAEQLLERLEQHLSFLRAAPHEQPTRHQSLHAMMECSWELLSSTEQAIFAQAAVFAGSFSIEAAEAILLIPPGDSTLVLDVLQSLRDKSLLRMNEQRLVFLDTIQEFAAEKLQTSGQTSQVTARHTDFFLDLADRLRTELEASPWTNSPSAA